jgi:ABC-type transporter Mla subunit MlaD
MSARYSQRANLLAGGFLLGGVMLAVAMSFMLADISLTRTAEYVIRFSLKDGATGLSPDAAVRVGGQQVGKVKAVRVEKDDQGRYVVNATVSIRADIELYEDAWAYLEVPLLGTASTINIPYLGDGTEVEAMQNGSPALAAGEILGGSIAPPAFLANAGFGPEQREQLQRMFNETERSLREFADTIETLRPKIEPAADDVMASIASARRSIESVEGDLTAWRTNISNTLANAETASADFPPMIDDAKLVLADAKEMIRSGRAVLDDNRPRIDNILADTEATIAGVKNDWVPSGTNLLTRATEGLDAYADLGKRADDLFIEQQPSLEKTLANLRTMSDQLKFLAIEARSQPWRLLHRPDTKELENQLLYDSARSYAVAVGDLRAASEAMEAVITRAGLTGEVDPAQLQAMRAELQEAFEHYASAESDLLDRMIEANR